MRYDDKTVLSSVMWFGVLGLPLPWSEVLVPGNEPWRLVTKAEFDEMWGVKE